MMVKARKRPAAKAVLTKEQAHRAIELATAIENREPMTSMDRHWLRDLLMTLANDALAYRPAHRKADNHSRDFYIAMDYILAGDVQKVVARRWKITPAALGQIVKRMRPEVDKIIAGSSATPEVWLRVVAGHRDRTAQTSVTKGLRKD